MSENKLIFFPPYRPAFLLLCMMLLMPGVVIANDGLSGLLNEGPGHHYFIIITSSIIATLLTLLAALVYYLIRMRKVQQRLCESENKYRTLVDHIPQCVFVKDKNLNYVSCNRIYAESLGVSAEQIIGKSDFELHPQHADEYRNIDQQVLKERKTIQLQEQHNRDGETSIIQIIKTPVYDDYGELSGVLGIYWDISATKQLEKSLQEKEQHMRIFMHSTGDCIWNWDMNNNVVERSIGFERAFGYTADEILPGIDWWIDRIHPDDQEQVMQTFTTALESRKSVCNYEYRFRCKDGSYSIVDDHVSIIRDKQNKAFRAMGAMRDITQHKQAETELLHAYQSLTQIQFAMDQVGIGIHFVDTQGRFMYVNQAACNMLGYGQQEMLKMGVPDIDPNFPADRFEELTAPLRKSQPGRIETTQLTRDGQIIPVDVSFHFIPGKTKTDGHFISFLVDLTERRQVEADKERLQQQLLQARKMETIGQLAGGLAHDFNNTLAAILGYTELLQDELAETAMLKEQCREYLNQITASGNRAKEVIAQMLLFSRNNGQQTDKAIPHTPIKSVMKEVVDLLHASIPSTIDIFCTLEDDQACVQLPAVQLHQLLLNLCINARDAIDTYGSIAIHQTSQTAKAECVACHADFSGDYVVLSVTDTGEGISQQVINQIFDPFFSTKAVGQGSGMGLSVVHGIVHSVGGHITIAQQNPTGTRINIFLPWVTQAVTEPPQQAAPVQGTARLTQLKGLKLMVVDDEAAVISMLKAYLSSRGAKLQCYQDPLAALADFNKNPHETDLLITDMTMPGLSGLDLSRKILQQRPALPIILCTGYSESVNEQIARQNGISRFMLKPVRMHNLVATINELLDRQVTEIQA